MLGGVGLYSELLDIKRRKENFINSAYVQKLFPGDLTSAIANEFYREGVISALFAFGYKFVLLDDDFDYWDLVLERMSNKKRDFILLLILGLSPADYEIFDEVFSSDSGKNSYHFEYIEYLFLEKKYELLETEVHKFIIDNTDRNKMTYAAHRFYLLSKIYQNTADMSDVITSRELAKGLPKDALKDEFDVWAVENILAE